MVNRREFLGVIAGARATLTQGPFGLLLELQVDGQGKVGGATVEQGPFRLPLVRR